MNALKVFLLALAIWAMTRLTNLGKTCLRTLARGKKRLARMRGSLAFGTLTGLRPQGRSESRIQLIRTRWQKEVDLARSSGEYAKRLLSVGYRKTATLWFKKAVRHWHTAEMYDRWCLGLGTSEPALKRRAA